MVDKAETAVSPKNTRTLVMAVTANFTAESVGDALRFWMNRLGLQPARLEFSAYNQVFQELIAPDSLLASSEPGVNFLLVRLEDWAREQKSADRADAISKAALEFAKTFEAFAKRTRRPTVLFIAPPSQAALENTRLRALLAELDAEVREAVGKLRGVHLIGARELAELYPVSMVDDPENDQQANIPFTAAYWAALGTMLARKSRALLSAPYKVIVVDGDNTLWGGVVGEIGATKVEIAGEYLELQRALKKQKSSGVLLALASKNEEADVAEVFKRSEMVLRREDFVACTINWEPKSQNIAALAKELELGLDSFVFLDDNPVECAEVQGNCPAVTTLQVPAAGAGRIASFLRHAWVFDRSGATATDEKRTELYREQGERNRFKTATTSFRDFIAGLNLQVVIEPPTPRDYERAAQLTQRTNQFNTTGIRRLSSELGALLESGERRMLMVSARDRFGDYGQVGLAVLMPDGQRLVAENILMSCRVLGKGVEHRLMAAIGREAERLGAAKIVIPFTRTERNQPAEKFLRSLGMQLGGDGTFQMSTAEAAAVEFTPGTSAPEEISEDGGGSRPSTSSAPVNFQEIATELTSADAILSAIANHLRRARPVLANELVLPHNAREALIAKIWEDVLHIDHVGVTDSFLSLGGQSLQAASIAARLAAEFGVHIPLMAVLSQPTIIELDELISRAKQSGAPASLPKAKEVSLSAAQQRLWFLDQFIPYRATYNIPLARRIRGPLNTDALKSALGAVTLRHAALRSSFSAHDGAAAITQTHAARLFFQEISAASETEALKLADAEASRQFNLSDEPLLRAVLISLGPADHLLVLNVHHIVSDGWSMGVLLKDLAEAYAAANAAREPSWRALPTSYADYAEWQRERLSAGDFQSDLHYWKNELRGAPALLELPSDMARPSVMTYAGGNVRKTISAATRRALEKLAERENCTPFAVMLTVFQTLLHRYSQQEDIVVGVPVAGRTHGALEEIIGCFVNTLAIRSGVDGEAAFTKHLAATRGKILEALGHQDLPFDYLVNELGLARDLSHSPVFQAMLVLQSDIDKVFVPAGTEVQSVDVHNGGAKFDVLLEITPAGNEYVLMLEFNKSLFVRETAERMLGHFARLLEQACASPETSLALLPMMEEQELGHTITLTQGKESAEFANAGLLHEIIERQVAATPNAPALSFENKTLTYGELNERANQLAHHLIKLGVGANELVGVCAERSIEMVIALLGTIKAGGAYMPLDPEYPVDRLGLMLQDAKPKAVLTQNSLRKILPPNDIPTISLDTEWSKISSEATTNPGVALTSTDAAYVIYTSGSTGIPKGVVNIHEGIVNRLLWMQDAYQLTAADRVLQKTPYSFDVSVWEFFWPLMTGAHLVVARPDGHRDPAYLAEIIVQAGITTLHFVPSMLRVFLEAVQLPKHAKLRQVFASGEALTADLQSMFFAASDSELFNLYGPTEAAVDVTHWTCRRNDPRSFVPIGYPITNIQIHVLDKKLKLVPVGIPGELHIGGIGLARGYLNRAELTAEKFVHDPYRAAPNARLYKTGDLARYLASGEVEYLGRIDHQVKIRGFRIELGEIESALSEHPGVRDVAVVARGDAPGTKRLVAYLVAATPAPEIGALRDHLKQTLPEYMVPSIFVFLEKMPLTISGKIDRKALPAPEQQRPELGDSYVAPRSEAEKKLAAIWSKALRLEQVGINDNFFELGGDSILSIQIISAARRVGLKLTPKLLFANQTIATLAAAAGVSETEHAEVTAGEIVAGNVPLTPVEHWFFEQHLADAQHFNQAFLFTVTEKLDRAVLESALGELSRHHDALRMRFERDENNWRQRYATERELAPLVWKDFSQISRSAWKTEIESTAAGEQASLNLQNGPLWRVVYFDLAEEPGRLLFVVHHLAVDGISWRPLLEDLESAYQQLKTTQKVVLPAKTASYKTWAEKLHALAASGALRKELPFWMTTTDPGAAEGALKPLVMDAKSAANDLESNAKRFKVALNRDATQALLQTVPAVYNTQINDVLLTALARAWANWSGSNVLCTNLEGHGRENLFEDVDISRTAGWFTSIFPVRLELRDSGKDWQPGEALKSVKEQLRRIPQRGVGYGILRYLSDGKELAKRPEPAMVFNYFGQFDQALAGSKLFRFAEESSGPWHAPSQKRRHVLEINSVVTGGHLEFECGYNPALHDEKDIQRFANEFLNALQEIIGHCQLPEAGGGTPSDFPLAKLDQSSLDQLLAGQRDVEDIYALSPIQTLFFSANHGGTQSAFDQWQCTLLGALNVADFERAWHETVRRHTILRSTIVSAGLREPLQVVHREVRLPWSNEDWRGAPREEQDRRWTAALKNDREQPLSLTDAPAMRFALVRLADETWKFLWSVPALLLDGWSWPLVFRDASRLYEAYAKGAAPQLEPARPYRDYLEWLGQQTPAEATKFWQEQLAGFRKPTTLPGDAPGRDAGDLGNGRYQQHVVQLSSDTTNALQAAARRLQVTLNTLVQGAWSILLSRQSGDTDVVFGAAFSGRPTDLPSVESIVGPFTNNLPVRVAVNAEETAGEFFRKVHERLLQLSTYQFTPLMDIQRVSEVPWRYRLFDSLIVFQNYLVDESARRLGGTVEIADFAGPVHSNYPVLLLAEPGGGLRLTLVYDRKTVARSTMERWGRDLEILLELAPVFFDKRVGELQNLLSARVAQTVQPDQAQAAQTQNFMPAQTEMEKNIASVWQKMFGLEQVNVEANFFDLGGHSLLLVQMHSLLREKLNSEFPIVALFEHPTVRALARHLGQPAESGTDKAEQMRDRAQRQKRALAGMRVPVKT